MPGYVIHMAVASRIIEEKGITDSSYIHAFLLGNIIPDAMERTAKKESHFWDDETYKNLNRIPNLDDFLAKYKDKMDNPFVLGYYAHLLLDNLFVKDYWAEHFELLDENMQKENGYELVKNIRVYKGDKVYRREDFLSDELYYGDYDRIYPYVFQDWPFISVEQHKLNEIEVEEIKLEKVSGTLQSMLDRVNKLYADRETHIKQELKIFELEHIYTLMKKVVSDVCDYMSRAGQ